MVADNKSYILQHLRGDERETARLDIQHTLLRACTYDGQLFHPKVLEKGLPTAVADIGCGTGIWLNDVSRDYYSESKLEPELIGFDVNTQGCSKQPEHGVKFIEHDCNNPFPQEYQGKFDVVQIRLLWPAIKRLAFPQFIKNALDILKPGGYIQWIEGEFGYFKLTPPAPEFDSTIRLMAKERKARGLMTHVPSDMLSVLLELRVPEKVDIVQFDTKEFNPERLKELGPDTPKQMTNLVFNAMKFSLQGILQRLNGNSEESEEKSQDLKEIAKANKFFEEASKELEKWSVEQKVLASLARKN